MSTTVTTTATHTTVGGKPTAPAVTCRTNVSTTVLGAHTTTTTVTGKPGSSGPS